MRPSYIDDTGPDEYHPYHASQGRNVNFDLIFAEIAIPPFQSTVPVQ